MAINNLTINFYCGISVGVDGRLDERHFLTSKSPPDTLYATATRLNSTSIPASEITVLVNYNKEPKSVTTFN